MAWALTMIRLITSLSIQCQRKISDSIIVLATVALLFLVSFEDFPDTRFALKSQYPRNDLCPHECCKSPPDFCESDHFSSHKHIDHTNADEICTPHGNHCELPVESSHYDAINWIREALENYENDEAKG